MLRYCRKLHYSLGSLRFDHKFFAIDFHRFLFHGLGATIEANILVEKLLSGLEASTSFLESLIDFTRSRARTQICS